MNRVEEIKKAYKEILKREGDDEGVNGYYKSDKTIEQIKSALQSSKEYQLLSSKKSNHPRRRPLAYERMLSESLSNIAPSFLVLTGCQGPMISQCLEFLTLGRSESLFIGSNRAEICAGGWKLYREKLDSVDYIYTQKYDIFKALVSVYEYKDKVKFFPVINCSAFHPDMTYINYMGKPLVGPMGDYHSAIITSAYFSDLPKEVVTEFFSKKYYDKFDFSGNYHTEILRLTDEFSGFDIDIKDFVKARCVDQAWMRTLNHPKKDIVLEVVIKSLDRDGISIINKDPRLVEWVVDDLSSNADWPAYSFLKNDIREEDLLFKSPYKINGNGIVLDLEQFVDYTYQSLAGIGRGDIFMQQANLEKMISILKSNF